MENRKRTISFNEELHRYTDEYNKEYTSVTTFLKDYEIPFDADYWSKKKAEEAGVSQGTILKNWDSLTREACARGNAIHKNLEDSINEAKNKPKLLPINLKVDLSKPIDLHLLASSPLGLKYPKILHTLIYYVEQGFVIYAEKRIYWAEILIAGTIDCLLVKGKQFLIIDWKTNKDDLKFEAGYYKKVNGIKTNQWVKKYEYFKAPISNLEHCKGNKYVLQLSMYAYLMELWGFECIGLILFQIQNKEVLLNGIKQIDQLSGNILMKDVVTDFKIPYVKSSCELLYIDRINVLNGTKNPNKGQNFTLDFGG